MGAVLTRAVQWTTDDSGGRTLTHSPLNQALLSEILQFMEELRCVPPETDSVFEEPLQWTTTLQVDDLPAVYIVSGTGAESELQDSEGRPLTVLNPPKVSVRCLSLASELLHLSIDKQAEVRNCLQENPDAAIKMVGSKFAALLKSGNDKEIDKEKAKDKEAKVQLLLLLQTLNRKILDKVMQEVSEHVHLDVTAVTCEVETLVVFCGDSDRDLLKSLRYTTGSVFSNGCRAPPHRQLLREMAYVVVEPFDMEPFSATYSSQGVFLNKGVTVYDADESDYEPTSETFEDLTLLLKKQSHYFAQNILNEHSILHLFRHQQPSAKGTEHGISTSSSSIEKWDRKQESKSKADFSLTPLPERYSKQKSRRPCSSRSEEMLSESSPESEEEEELDRRLDTSTDLPSDQLKLQKLIKYLRKGDRKIWMLTMCLIMEFNLKQETYQLALRDLGSLEPILNILDTNHFQCVVLCLVSAHPQIQRSMVKMRGVQSLVPLLDRELPEFQALAAETLANVAKYRKARRTVRHCGGIDKLVRLLDCSPREEQSLEAARCGALALWSLSLSSRNKEAIRKAGGIPLLGRLLHSSHTNLLIPVIGTLQECASEESYRQAIGSEGMIKDLVKNLSSDNDELQMHSARAIFKCGDDEKMRELVYQYKGPLYLAKLLSKAHNKPLLAAATGAIWKCSLSQKNIKKFQEQSVVQSLVALLSEQAEEVLVNVVAALGEFAHIPENKNIIGQSGGIEQLVRLLTNLNQALVVNVTKTLGVCATDMKNMAIIEQLDGLRLVWSLLKNPSPEVQASAAWALCPIIENGKGAGESLRSLFEGLELLIKLLKTNDNAVLTSICAVIAKVTEDKEENVAILTDYGVVPLLANLTSTTDERLQRHLAEAITHCCAWRQNLRAFGKAGAVAPLVQYVKSQNEEVHETTVVALYELSKDVDNCITLHSKGVVQPLLKLMGHDKEEVAFMAAGCVRNIRMLANANKWL